MSARPRLAGLLAALGTAMPAVALAQQGGDGSHGGGDTRGANEPLQVAISATAVDPSRVTVLVGESVEWVNASIREHTVTSRDGLFDSPRLRPGGRFGHTFTRAGSFAYFCRIHPNIEGTADVADVLMHTHASQLVRGDELKLDGRTHPGDGPVTIERDPGTGFATVATVPRARDGSFSARLAADASATYRAAAGNDVSPPVRVEVVPARALTVTAERGRRRQLVRVTLAPPLPGGTVHLQRNLKERFGWWTIRRARLARGRTATIGLPRGSKARVRIVLTRADGETRVAISRLVKLPG
ncbi:MAG: hypothetical protein M3417_02725 [Actinomycetota bacterium]|nr:hypothetical protein [Actinomycetota bacterium]